MDAKILKTITDRTEFLLHLEQEIKNNNSLIEESKNRLHSLQETSENIKILSQQSEHSSLIPLAKNIYLPGRIIHTGEYYVKKKAYPDSYTMLQTLDQTLESLDNRIKEEKVIIEKSEQAKQQLEERINILSGERTTADMQEEMPKEIKSDKGVALKVGEFYEILEFED